MHTESASYQRVRVFLTARRRADWSAVVEVPQDASQQQLSALVDRLFHDVPMDDYVLDDEFWGKGECGFSSNVDAAEPAQLRAELASDGQWVHRRIAPRAITVWCVVHGEAFVPATFASRAQAEDFRQRCSDYVSGPWEIAVDV